MNMTATSRLANLLGSASFLTIANALAAHAQQVAQAPTAQATQEELPENVLITGSLIRGTVAVGVPVVNLLRVPQFFDEQSARLRLPVNRFDLADYLGVASRSAERAFARLEKQGLVRRITPRIIEILDMDGLRRLQLEQRRSHH